jgi:hypothetical protein
MNCVLSQNSVRAECILKQTLMFAADVTNISGVRCRIAELLLSSNLQLARVHKSSCLLLFTGTATTANRRDT